MADFTIENLITKLGFEYNEKELNKFNDGIKDAVKGLMAVGAAAATAAAGIFAFTAKIANSNDELGKFAQRVGIDIEALQELGYAAELNGGSVDSMNSSLANLAKISSEAARGVGSGVEVFGMLGMSVTDTNGKIKEADTLFEEVADRVSKLDDQAQKLEFAQKLGINEDLILTLQQGSEALKQQRKEARDIGLISKEETEAAAEFNDTLLRLSKLVSKITSVIGTRLMKQITPVIKSFNNWAKANRELIAQNISSFLDKVSRAISIVWNVSTQLFGGIQMVVKVMGGWKNVIIIITGLLMTLNATALLIPLLIAAAAVGILLLLNEIKVFAEGGDSVLGDLIKRFPILDKAIEKTKLAFKGTGKFLAGIFGDIFSGIKRDFINLSNFVITEVNALVKNIIKLLNKIPYVDIGIKEGKPVDTESALDSMGEALKTQTIDFLKFFNPDLVIPPNSNPQSSVINQGSSNTKNVNNVTINVANGTKETMIAAVEEVLQIKINTTEENLSSNVVA